MCIIQPTNKTVLSLKGLHLHHTARSNCAARVGLMLEKKSAPGPAITALLAAVAISHITQRSSTGIIAFSGGLDFRKRSSSGVRRRSMWRASTRRFRALQRPRSI